MRNKDFESDQLVFSFINSEQCCSYEDLRYFLISNDLPLLERWLFYFLGKKDEISKYTIEEMKNESSFGGYVYGAAYYWKEYLSNEKQEKEDIITELKNNREEITEDKVHKMYLQNGWTYVDDNVNMESYIMGDDSITEEFTDNEVSERGRSEFCGACESSPCRCSDREKTSTMHDF